ncbi:DUF885 domain-containing protein [Lacimicrobium sp. SS2-24]|uniref:DUF885 domain-containing protein n=1 Tax=Lacimicrobium sp. SS2-24 TaxID=2005569 RepID=UPI000B4B103C|nr:DUF885 domain-containing protein [Lacimicrobium sp. SS2-24]
MKPSYYLLILCLGLLISCGGSGSDNTPAPVQTPPPLVISDVDDYELADTQALLSDIEGLLQGLPVAEFFEQSYAILQARNPELALSEGEMADDATLTNISDAYLLQTAAIQNLILEKLAQYESTTDPQQSLSVDIYRYYLQQQLSWAEFHLYSYPATYGNFGWPGSTAFFFTELLPVTSEEQAQQYLTLARQVGRRMRQIGDLLETRQQAGIIEPKVTLQFSLNQVNALAQQTAVSTPYYQTFLDKLSQISGLSNDQRQQLLTEASAIVEQIIQPAYQQLATQMTQLLTQAPDAIGFSQYPEGQAFYDFVLSHYTDSQRSAEDIHQLGLQELARIHAQMNALFDQLGYPSAESIGQKLNRVATDGGTVSAAQVVPTFEALIAQAYNELPGYFEHIPQQQLVVIGGATGGYYVSGSDDGTRPGAFYAKADQARPYYTMPTLAYHEGVPGHHLQIALAKELSLPTFRQQTHFISFVEGWGLYAERLAKDVGWYEQDIYADIGRLEFEAMRAARLVLDTGIHAKGWTYAQAEAFSLEAVGNRGSIARYSVYPGQATAYMTGMLDLLNLREEIAERQGEDFSLAEFHRHLLGQGAVPLSLLRPYILNNLAQQN